MRLWFGVLFIGYVILVLVAWAFIAGASRKRTPTPLDDLDGELEEILDRGGVRRIEWEGS